LKSDQNLRNVDAAIVAVAQLIQPCQLDALATQAKTMLGELNLDKREFKSRINGLVKVGHLWSRSDGQLLLAPKAYDLSKASLPPKERDKLRLLLLNNSRYK